MKGYLRLLLKRKWLIIILFLACLLRTPTLFEPNWYGDEGVYLTIGQEINRGKVLYKDIHDNKPPMIYLLATIVDGNQFWFRVIATGANILTILFFGLIAKRLFENDKWIYIASTIVFATFTNIPLLEGNIANAENFFLFPSITAAWILVKISNKNYKAQIFGAGLLFGIATLFKIPAGLEVGVWPLLWTALNEKDKVKKIVILGIGFLTPILLSVGMFTYLGALQEYLVAVGVQNSAYISSWQTAPAGFYDIKNRVIILIVILAVTWGFAKRLGKYTCLIIMWFTVTIFAALISGRPYPHYLLQVIAPTTLSMGLILVRKKKEVLIGGMILATAIGTYIGFSFWRYPVTSYYVNFLEKISGYKSEKDYQQWFDPQVVNNYEIARVIRELSSDTDDIFVWGDQPMIYTLSRRGVTGRYTTKYHISDFKAETQTIEQIEKDLPKIVISFGEDNKLEGFEEIISSKYKAEKQIGGATLYARK